VVVVGQAIDYANYSAQIAWRPGAAGGRSVIGSKMFVGTAEERQQVGCAILSMKIFHFITAAIFVVVRPSGSYLLERGMVAKNSS
jgi:hypothetical protein